MRHLEKLAGGRWGLALPLPDFCFPNSGVSRSGKKKKPNSNFSKEWFGWERKPCKKVQLESEERISVEVCNWMLTGVYDSKHWLCS